MNDTHINAYFGAVEEAAQKVKQANAEYQAAFDRLEAKKRELGMGDGAQQPASEPSPKHEQPAPAKKK